MGDYEQTTTVSADADALFAYLSDVENLPRYFAATRSAEPAGGDAVHTEAEVDGQRVEGEAWFRTEDGDRTITRGSEGPHDYRGELAVSGDGATSQVTVRLHTEHGDADTIERGLAETLATIKKNVEQDADPKAP